MQFNIRGLERWNTYKAYLKPVRGQENLQIVTGARVNRLIVEDGVVSGVEVDVQGVPTEAYAAETILCAGALDSPRLLRSEEHTSALQSLMRISYAVFCLNKHNLSPHTL